MQYKPRQKSIVFSKSFQVLHASMFNLFPVSTDGTLCWDSRF